MTLLPFRTALLAAGAAAVLALAPVAADAHDGHGRGGHQHRHGWHDRGHLHQHRHGWHDRGQHHRHGWRDRDDHRHNGGWHAPRHHGWQGGAHPYPGAAYGYRVVPPPVWLPAPRGA